MACPAGGQACLSEESDWLPDEGDAAQIMIKDQPVELDYAMKLAWPASKSSGNQPPLATMPVVAEGNAAILLRSPVIMKMLFYIKYLPWQ